MTELAADDLEWQFIQSSDAANFGQFGLNDMVPQSDHVPVTGSCIISGGAGGGASTLNFTRGRDQISQFQLACRNYATNGTGTATAAGAMFIASRPCSMRG